MTHHPTPQAADTATDKLLTELFKDVSDWDRNLIEQAVEAFGANGRPFSCNDFRDLLPDMAHAHIGLAFRSMASRKPPAIVEVGQVRSTASSTHGKRIGVYVLAQHAVGMERAA